MPLARIILAGVNVLLAIVFLWLASADWGKRYLWSHGVWRYDVALNGLPLDEKQLDEESTPEVRNLTEGNLKLLFKSNPVKTQKEEVDKRFSQLKGDLDGIADEAARRQRLQGVLRDLARTSAERESFADMTADDLSAALERAFAPASTGQFNGKDLAPDQWRREIAHVLFCVENKPEEQDRLVTILGVRSYAGAADRVAAARHDMELRVERGMASDRAAFELQHKQTVQRILFLTERVADLKASLQQHRELTEKHQKLLNARQADVKQFEEKLGTASAELQKGLAEQAALEQELFETQRALGEASAKNLQLERDIRSREKEAASK